MKRWILGIVIISLSLAGCTIGDGPYQQPEITFEGTINVTENGFSMNGEITNLEDEPTPFENVTVALYSANNELIREVDAGALDRRTDISITAVEVPEYVIISSPEFWKRDDISVDYFIRTRDGPGYYRTQTAHSRSDLPVPPSTNRTDFNEIFARL